MNKIVIALFLGVSIIASAPTATARPPGSFPDSKGATSANIRQDKLVQPPRPWRGSANIPTDSATGSAANQVQQATPSERAANQKQSGFQYRYVSLDPFTPPGFLFFDPIKILENKQIYGVAYACDQFCIPSIAKFHRGAVKILHQNAVFYDSNRNGIIGGSVVVDNANFIEQAALFDDGDVKLIPRIQGEISSHVMRITDSGLALVQSAGENYPSYYLYKNRKATKLDFGTIFVDLLNINNEGTISGTMQVNGHQRAFRFNPSSRKLTVLNPLPTEPTSWGLAINNQNEVLGYSFIGWALERIGIWKGEQFITYFVEGTPQFPTVSNSLLWNHDGLIVITAANDAKSYLVPKPGVRLNLADVVDGVPTGVGLNYVRSINERGDLTGSDTNGGAFLLERLPTSH